MSTIPAEQTQAEVDFLERCLPHPHFTYVADLCCGDGRHARPLASRGHRVVGVDVNAGALSRGAAMWDAERAFARGSLTFVEGDVRRVRELDGPFDGITCLWASFGFFSAAENRAFLRDIAAQLRSGGRFVVDLYHRDFFAGKEGERAHHRAGETIIETKRIDGDRLHIVLAYENGTADRLEWELFTPEQLRDAAATCGLAELVACTGFDERRPPNANEPRMQLAFEKLAR